MATVKEKIQKANASKELKDNRAAIEGPPGCFNRYGRFGRHFGRQNRFHHGRNRQRSLLGELVCRPDRGSR